LIEDCSLIKKPLCLNEKYYKEVMKDKHSNKEQELEFDDKDKSRLWVQMIQKDQETGNIESNGKVAL
jgi:hypothetical protein